jgi:sugar (pentulose or hexulose) kinase
MLAMRAGFCNHKQYFSITRLSRPVQSHATVVLDVGKTLTKAGLWDSTGTLIERRFRLNARPEARGYLALDTAGIETWLAATLRDFAQMERVGRIIPVAHGAAAALIRDGALHAPPVDYEHPIPAAIHREYDEQREPFRLTGSPALPAGLNLGAQLHFLERTRPDIWSGEPRVLPWPQYWSWRLSGCAASEVTSLGCHTDLWYPIAAGYSRTAKDRGWAQRFAPLARADAVVGPISPEWIERGGLPGDAKVLCGLHDSNAALIAARALAGAERGDMTVLSTGTWFVAMRAPSGARFTGLESLPIDRDCLVNVDWRGEPIPSARFMGGREIETLMGADGLEPGNDEVSQVAAADAVIAKGAMILPTFAPGAGPYGQCSGRWLSRPNDPLQRWAAVCLYAALLSDAALDLIGSKDRLIVEGRFAAAALFVASLAALRPHMGVHAAPSGIDVSLGALTLLQPRLLFRGALARVGPLPLRLNEYRERWRQECLR